MKYSRPFTRCPNLPFDIPISGFRNDAEKFLFDIRKYPTEHYGEGITNIAIANYLGIPVTNVENVYTWNDTDSAFIYSDRVPSPTDPNRKYYTVCLGYPEKEPDVIIENEDFPWVEYIWNGEDFRE